MTRTSSTPILAARTAAVSLSLSLVLSLLAVACGDDDGNPGDDGGPNPTIDAGPNNSPDASPPPVTGPGEPAVARGGVYMGFDERFNRYYTDPDWQPSRTVYVSPAGGGDGSSAGSPTTPDAALNAAQPGDQIVFTRGTYAGCFELDGGSSGTYDDPIVLFGERQPDGRLGVRVDCCDSGRRTCFNLEDADYVAIDGFEVAGGRYGIRSVSASYSTIDHNRGNAVLNCWGHDNSADPFFTGGTDWFVIENNLAERGGQDDGHGIYLSNGADWNIARYNTLNDNTASDFQINADPISTCEDEGIDYFDPQCDGAAADGLGDGVSEFMLVEGNYFHNGRAQGANFTSVRNSLVRNNIFAFYQRHGVTFWQETPNPNLGSSDNRFHHNLLIGENGRELLQFMRYAARNDVRNNVIVGVSLGGAVSANPSTIVLAVSDSSDTSVFAGNYYIGGRLARIDDDFNEVGGAQPNDSEFSRDDFDPSWFAAFPADRLGAPAGFAPAASAPWLDLGALLPETPIDRDGTARTAPTDLGPYERP